MASRSLSVGQLCPPEMTILRLYSSFVSVAYVVASEPSASSGFAVPAWEPDGRRRRSGGIRFHAAALVEGVHVGCDSLDSIP